MAKRRRDDEEWLPPSKSKSRTVARQEASNETFYRLPDELLLRIFSFVPLYDRGAVLVTSRRFNRVMLDWTLWTKVPIMIPTEWSETNLKRIYDTFGKNPIHLPVEALFDFFRPKLTNRSRRSVVAHVKRVMRKVCKFCNHYSVKKLRLALSGDYRCFNCVDDVRLKFVSLRCAQRYAGVTQKQFDSCNKFVCSKPYRANYFAAKVTDLITKKALDVVSSGSSFWTCHRHDCADVHRPHCPHGFSVCETIYERHHAEDPPEWIPQYILQLIDDTWEKIRDASA